MTGIERKVRTGVRRAAVAVAALGLVGACGHLMMMRGNGMEPPAASEFGMGPRASAGGAYRAVLEPAGDLGIRRMHSATLTLRTADERPVEGARIRIDGGMPQHGHGLPTAPRVTRSLGEGAYRVEGLRFNMPGWWVLTFHVESSAGADSVVFNLDL